ncbi:MAG: hypothetical protein FWE44_07930 [Defluviitaleaceae bacterium]|nr:hypothetical protein [Defluviitaleaceae bacterium]
MRTIRIDKIVGAAFCRLLELMLCQIRLQDESVAGGRMPPLREPVAVNFNRFDCPLPFLSLDGRCVM